MKKFFITLLSAVLIFSFTSCIDDNENASDNTEELIPIDSNVLDGSWSFYELANCNKDSFNTLWEYDVLIYTNEECITFTPRFLGLDNLDPRFEELQMEASLTGGEMEITEFLCFKGSKNSIFGTIEGVKNRTNVKFSFTYSEEDKVLHLTIIEGASQFFLGDSISTYLLWKDNNL